MTTGKEAMPKPVLVYACVVLLVFAAGLAMGLYFGGQNGGASSAKANATSRTEGLPGDVARDRLEQNVANSKHIRELEEEVAKQKSEIRDAIIADHLELLKKSPSFLAGRVFDQNLKIAPETAFFFKMTAPEKSAVENHLVQIRDEMKSMLAPSVVVSRQSPTQMNCQIPALPDAAAEKQRLNDLLAGDLGADRANALMTAVGSYTTEMQLYGFGAVPFTVQVGPDTAGEGQSMAFRFKIRFPNGEGNDMSFQELPPAFQGLIPFDPPQTGAGQK